MAGSGEYQPVQQRVRSGRQGRPQRSLPLRLREEVQEVLRRERVEEFRVSVSEIPTLRPFDFAQVRLQLAQGWPSRPPAKCLPFLKSRDLSWIIGIRRTAMRK